MRRSRRSVNSVTLPTRSSLAKTSPIGSRTSPHGWRTRGTREKRLNDILANRTGNVQSVLEVEREIARVRSEIESLDAQRVKLDDRVAYATVSLRVTEERRATLDSGPFPLSGRLRNALVDGLRDALDSVIQASLWTLRAGPVLILWGAVVWLVARVFMRRFRPAAKL